MIKTKSKTMINSNKDHYPVSISKQERYFILSEEEKNILKGIRSVISVGLNIESLDLVLIIATKGIKAANLLNNFIIKIRMFLRLSKSHIII